LGEECCLIDNYRALILELIDVLVVINFLVFKWDNFLQVVAVSLV
jgi:hypothetical protein